LDDGREFDVVGDVGRTPGADEVLLEVGGGGALTILLIEGDVMIRLGVGLMLPAGGDCMAELAIVGTDTIIDELEGGTTDVMLVVGIDMGVVDVTVAVVIGVGPMDDIAVVELVAELIVE
jgi:hypothetical protein